MNVQQFESDFNYIRSCPDRYPHVAKMDFSKDILTALAHIESDIDDSQVGDASSGGSYGYFQLNWNAHEQLVRPYVQQLKAPVGENRFRIFDNSVAVIQENVSFCRSRGLPLLTVFAIHNMGKGFMTKFGTSSFHAYYAPAVLRDYLYLRSGGSPENLTRPERLNEFGKHVRLVLGRDGPSTPVRPGFMVLSFNGTLLDRELTEKMYKVGVLGMDANVYQYGGNYEL